MMKPTLVLALSVMVMSVVSAPSHAPSPPAITAAISPKLQHNQQNSYHATAGLSPPRNSYEAKDDNSLLDNLYTNPSEDMATRMYQLNEQHHHRLEPDNRTPPPSVVDGRSRSNRNMMLLRQDARDDRALPTLNNDDIKENEIEDINNDFDDVEEVSVIFNCRLENNDI